MGRRTAPQRVFTSSNACWAAARVMCTPRGHTRMTTPSTSIVSDSYGLTSDGSLTSTTIRVERAKVALVDFLPQAQARPTDRPHTGLAPCLRSAPERQGVATGSCSRSRGPGGSPGRASPSPGNEKSPTPVRAGSSVNARRTQRCARGESCRRRRSLSGWRQCGIGPLHAGTTGWETGPMDVDEYKQMVEKVRQVLERYNDDYGEGGRTDLQVPSPRRSSNGRLSSNVRLMPSSKPSPMTHRWPTRLHEQKALNALGQHAAGLAALGGCPPWRSTTGTRSRDRHTSPPVGRRQSRYSSGGRPDHRSVPNRSRDRDPRPGRPSPRAPVTQQRHNCRSEALSWLSAQVSERRFSSRSTARTRAGAGAAGAGRPRGCA